MADVLKDSYDESRLFTRVVFQRNKDVCDFELNELQEIITVFLFRTMYNGTQNVFSGMNPLNPGSNDDGWKVVGTGASNSVTIDAGWLFCDGIPLNNAASFSQGGFTTYGGAGSRTDVVYLEVTEVEVDDPNQVPQLGDTTKRRQLQVTVGISTTGMGGVPPNTSEEIWEGGAHYFPIASINRPTGQAIINSGDVTDLRKLLPPSIMAEIIRQSNFQVQALVGTVLETPGIGGNPLAQANSITLDVDPGASFSGNGFARVRFNRNGVPVVAFRVNERTNAGGISSWETDEVIRLSDANTVGSTFETVPFSDSPSESDRLRFMEQDPGTNSQTQNMLRSMNARLSVTCGNGTTTFGDFNGATAIRDAIVYAAAVASGQSFRIQVKPGTYTWSGATTIAGKELIIEAIAGGGAGGTEVVINNTFSSTTTAPILVTSGRLQVRGITFTKGDASLLAIKAVGGVVYCEDCYFSNQSVYMEIDDVTHIQKAPELYMRRCMWAMTTAALGKECVILVGSSSATAGLARAGYIFDACSFVITGNANCCPLTIKQGTADSSMRDITFNDCRMLLGSTTGTTATFDSVTHNCGVVRFDSNGANNKLTVHDVTWNRCNVFANSTGAGTSSILMHARAALGGTDRMLVNKLAINGGRWQCPAQDTEIIPFVVCGVTFEGTNGFSPFRSISLIDLDFGFQVETGGFVAHTNGQATVQMAVPVAAAGASTTVTSAMMIHVTKLCRIHNLTILNACEESDGSGSPGSNEGGGELTVYQPETYDIQGIRIRNWHTGGGGDTPWARFQFWGWTKEGRQSEYNTVSKSNDFVGSSGVISGIHLVQELTTTRVANVGIISVVPCGYLHLADCVVEGFDTSDRAIAIENGTDTDSGPPLLLFWEPVGLRLTGCQFLGNEYGLRYDQVDDAVNCARLIIDSCLFHQNNQGVRINAGGSFSMDDGAHIINNSFLRNTGVGLHFVIGGATGAANPLFLTGNQFVENNGGLANVQARVDGADAFLKYLIRDNDFHSTGQISVHDASATGRGLETALTGTARTMTNGADMLFNVGVLTIVP